MEVEARSVGCEVDSLARIRAPLSVELAGERVIYLRAGADDVLAVSLGAASPHSIVLDAFPRGLGGVIAPGQQAGHEADRLVIGPLSIRLNHAPRVNRPRPLGALPSREAVRWGLRILPLIAREGSILDPPSHLAGLYSAFLARASEAVRTRDIDLLISSAAGLLGAGGGLTPSGDDLLSGILYGCYLAGIEVDSAWVVKLAAERSSWPSYVLVRHARSGCLFHQHYCLYRALIRGSPDDILSEIISASSVGHSSGSDMALGLMLALAVA